MNMSRNSFTKINKEKMLASAADIMNFIGKGNYVEISDGSALDFKVSNFKSMHLAKQHDMTFCSAEGDRAMYLIGNCQATIIICPLSLRAELTRKRKSALILVENPRLWFARCIAKFGKTFLFNEKKGVHHTAIVETKNIGRNVVVGPHCYIAREVTIGENTIIHGGVQIYGKTTIGDNVMINSNTVIGEDGFGFEKNQHGKWEKFPHLGGVEIQNDIEIGANTCIDKGTLENTVIGSGTKIDNLVHIAHNVKVGKSCMIIAQSLIAGSCILEDGAYVAMSACIREGVRLGENCFVGMGAVVTNDVKKGEIVFGVPAKPRVVSGINDI
jgi:UDP-3-O-[3-hydroxymyristoyl] glucosamine N-acyltransferase